MRRLVIAAVLSIGVGALLAVLNTAPVAAERGSEKIALLDDCDPRIGAGWNIVGNLTGCIREEGSVSRAEFGAFLASPFSLSVVGHPSWTIAPTYVKAEPGEKLRVKNAGGRGHTFTEVAQFGGGFVPALRVGLTQVAECTPAAAPIIAPGARAEVTGLGIGNHRFQCCIHSWMRALIKVEAEE